MLASMKFSIDENETMKNVLRPTSMAGEKIYSVWRNEILSLLSLLPGDYIDRCNLEVFLSTISLIELHFECVYVRHWETRIEIWAFLGTVRQLYTLVDVQSPKMPYYLNQCVRMSDECALKMKFYSAVHANMSLIRRKNEFPRFVRSSMNFNGRFVSATRCRAFLPLLVIWHHQSFDYFHMVNLKIILLKLKDHINVTL
jgi:hypothetical protein